MVDLQGFQKKAPAVQTGGVVEFKKVFELLRRKGPDVRAFRFTDGQAPKVDGDLTKPFWWYRNEIKPEHTFYALKDMFTG